MRRRRLRIGKVMLRRGWRVIERNGGRWKGLGLRDLLRDKRGLTVIGRSGRRGRLKWMNPIKKKSI